MHFPFLFKTVCQSMKWVTSIYRNPLTRAIKATAFYFFSLFFYPKTLAFFSQKIRCLDKNTQLFIVTRKDFGTFLLLLHYVRIWQKTRGETAIVLLSPKWPLIRRLAGLISPNTQLIFYETKLARFAFRCFNKRQIQQIIFPQLYSDLLTRKLDTLYIYDQPASPRFPDPGTRYIAHLDPYLQNIPPHFSSAFLNAYKTHRTGLDNRRDVMEDLFKLNQDHPELSLNQAFPADFNALAAQLNIKQPIVVVNLNYKRYYNSACRRSIQNPDRYNALFDLLIEKGYDVVLQGREEQPSFPPRHGLIDYAHSTYVSPENDLALFSHAACAILSKTGVEIFTAICGIPVLGLDYSELATVQPNPMCRFYPKKLRHKTRNELLSWHSMLHSPSFFDIGGHSFQNELAYEDMESEEILEATHEFLDDVEEANWSDLSPRQQQFRSCLTPLHLDLFHVPMVPCDCFLRKFT